MADKKFMAFDPIPSLSLDDSLLVNDKSDTTQSTEGSTKRGTLTQLANFISSNAPSTIENYYDDVTDLIANQLEQTSGQLQYTTDGSDHAEVASGFAYFEYLGTTVGTLDDYRLLGEDEAEVITVIINQSGYRVFKIKAIQDDGTPITAVNGGKISFEYSGANVTAIVFNARYTDAIAEFYGTDVNVKFYNRTTQKYQTESIASGAWTTVNTDYYRGAVTGTNIQIADLTITDRVEFFITAASVGGGGVGDMLASNNLSDLVNKATSRTNLEIDTTVNQTDSTDKRFMTDAQETKLDSVETNADVTDAANIEDAITGTSADTLIDTSIISFVKAATLVKITWLNFKAAIKTYTDTLYVALANYLEEKINGTATEDATLTGTENIDLSAHADAYYTLTGNTTISVTNTPAADKSFVKSWTIKSTAAETLTLPAAWIVIGEYVADTSENFLTIRFSNFTTAGAKVICYITQDD